jgi:hypothetical protein
MKSCRVSWALFIGLLLGFWVSDVLGAPQAQAQIAIDSPNPQAHGWFGSAVASGDVNGDGRADIIVGARSEDVGTTPNQGRVYVFDGSTRALIHTLIAPGSPSCGSQGCRFGQAVDGADITGDGRADILVGAPFEDVAGNSRQGRAYVFDGATGALIFTLNSPDPQSYAYFGDSVAAGDVNGDDRADVIVGGSSQDVDVPPVNSAGQVFVFDGMTGGLIHTLNTPNPFPNGLFGRSVVTGDMNDDGRADIVVGAPGEIGGNGRVHIFNGSTGALIRTLGGIPHCDLGHPKCWFGSSVGVLGVDGGGPPAILIGAPLEDVEGVPDQGRAYVFSPAGGAPLHMFTTPSPGSGCSQECNRFGVAVVAADVNGDGQSDFIVGANAEPNYQGRVYVFNGVGGSLLRTLDSPSPVETNEVLFGSAVAAGDVDADGKADVIVGAFRDDVDGVEEQGRAYLFFSGLKVTVELDPDLRLGRGETTTARATVREAGFPHAGKTVNFRTGDTSLASVVPPGTDTTDENGQAEATIRGETWQRTTTTVTAEVNGTSGSATVRVPDLSVLGLFFLAICVVLSAMLSKRAASAQR